MARLIVERGQTFRCKAKRGYHYVTVTSVHIDRSSQMTGQVWVGLIEIPDPESKGARLGPYPVGSPLWGFKRGEPFTSYLTMRDGAWQMQQGYEMVGWNEPPSEVPDPPKSARVNSPASEAEAAPKKPKKQHTPPPPPPATHGNGLPLPKKRRGRPPGSKNKPKAASVDLDD